MISCEHAAELLSARQDGELEPAERREVEEHLSACAGCRGLEERFAAVDRLAALGYAGPLPDLHDEVAGRLARRNGRPAGKTSADGTPGLRRILRVAAAAVVIIAVSLVILVTSDQAGADDVSAHINALKSMNNQALLSQDTLLKTFEWDLNAMKLQVRCADLGDNEERDLLARIDGLLQAIDDIAVEEIENRNDSTQEGQ